MRRTITTAVPLPPGDEHGEVLRGDPGLWLPGARPQGLACWSVELAALNWTRPVLVEVGETVETGAGPSRRLEWYPVTLEGDLVAGDRWLPGFEGDLRLVGGSDAPSLALIGEALLPFGLLGAAIDAVALRAVADRSLDDLLRRIAVGLVADQGSHALT